VYKRQASVGADTQPWIDGAKAEIDELDGNEYYDVIGLAGAVYGLAFVGEDFDPAAGEHAAAESLSDLADILASYQIDGGGFTWNSAYTLPGNDDETIQETAYAALALDKVDPVVYQGAISGAVNYLVSVQLDTGGWKNWAGGNENNEITGEALWAIGLKEAPVSNANGPYLVPFEESIGLDGTASFDPLGVKISYNWTLGMTEPETSASLGTLSGADSATPVFTAGEQLGVQYVELEVSDGVDSSIDNTWIVIYDPSAGFVTGGGWIDSKPGDYKLPDFNIDQLVWDQGFEADTDGWYDANSAWYGLVSQVPSGENGISSASGAFHSVMEGDAASGPFSRFDGYRDTWAGTWTAEIDVYLDPDWAAGTGFDYSVAASGSDGLHQRDYIFHVTKDTSTGKLLVAGSNNTNFAPREDLENLNHFEVVDAGWYTLQHVFYENAGALAVDLNLLDSTGNVLFTETRYNAADLIPDEVGGNRYAWFTVINVNGGIAVDNHQLVFPTSTGGKASFGFVSKYQRGAVVPTGNTTFVFQDADLNFKSESYDWLLVTGSDYAKFKGDGTINSFSAPNGQPYKFMVWAGDGDAAGEPDTFRIKIWYEGGAGEVVVYDNGMDQAIGGGNIVVHSGKTKK
jgi:hypothetical protein